MVEPRISSRLDRQVAIFAVLIATLCGSLPARATAADEVLPKHITPETLKAVRDGLDYLARSQADDGAWHEGQGHCQCSDKVPDWPVPTVRPPK